MGEENLVGKLACKSHGGLFGGLVGRVEENTSGRGVSPYILVLADGTRLGAFPKDLVIVGESACELYSETKCDEMKLRECYITKGKKELSEDKWEYWESIAPSCVRGIYKGNDLRQSLELVKMLNERKSFEEVKEMMMSQGHSGMSFSLVRQIVENISDRGKEFSDYVK